MSPAGDRFPAEPTRESDRHSPAPDALAGKVHLSIIVPVYQGAPLLRELIGELLAVRTAFRDQGSPVSLTEAIAATSSNSSPSSGGRIDGRRLASMLSSGAGPPPKPTGRPRCVASRPRDLSIMP